MRQRIQTLYQALGVPHPENQSDANYYTTIDSFPAWPGAAMAQSLPTIWYKNFESIDFVWRLASEKSLVLLDGGGFDAPNMSVRASLANLQDEAYATIGHGISELLADYYQTWQTLKK